jgi:hypothetical protein
VGVHGGIIVQDGSREATFGGCYHQAVLIPVTISVAAAIAMFALIFGAYWLATRVAQGEGLTLGGLRWYPSPLALLILLPIAGLLMWRFSLGFLIIPIILPFFWRRGFGERFAAWTQGRNRRRSNENDSDDRPQDDW